MGTTRRLSSAFQDSLDRRLHDEGHLLAMLQSMGCGYAQGFLFARPMDVGSIPERGVAVGARAA